MYLTGLLLLLGICRLIQPSIRALRQDLVFFTKSKVLEVSSEVGFLPCSVTVRKVLASLGSMSSSRSIILTLRGLSMLPSIRP